MRRVGYGLEGGGVLTKARLREMLNNEDQVRVLVNQLMNVGRDVRSTPMQWAYEGKKLDATVKHMSWRPPWVEAGDEGSDDEEGRRYLGTDTWCDVPDIIGLGRYPLTWRTLNCKYNAAYDVHRFNTACTVQVYGPIRNWGEWESTLSWFFYGPSWSANESGACRCGGCR